MINIENVDGEEKYRILLKGMKLIEAKGYAEKARRDQIDYEIKEKQLVKATWDVNKMKTTYLLAWIAILLSIVNILKDPILTMIKSAISHFSN